MRRTHAAVRAPTAASISAEMSGRLLPFRELGPEIRLLRWYFRVRRQPRRVTASLSSVTLRRQTIDRRCVPRCWNPPVPLRHRGRPPGANRAHRPHPTGNTEPPPAPVRQTRSGPIQSAVRRTGPCSVSSSTGPLREPSPTDLRLVGAALDGRPSASGGPKPPFRWVVVQNTCIQPQKQCRRTWALPAVDRRAPHGSYLQRGYRPPLAQCVQAGMNCVLKTALPAPSQSKSIHTSCRAHQGRRALQVACNAMTSRSKTLESSEQDPTISRGPTAPHLQQSSCLHVTGLLHLRQRIRGVPISSEGRQSRTLWAAQMNGTRHSSHFTALQCPQSGLSAWLPEARASKRNVGYFPLSNRAKLGTPRHNTAQHSTAQHGTSRHGTVQHGTAQDETAQHSTARHSRAEHSTAQHGTAEYSTAQQSKAQQSTARHGRAHHLTAQYTTEEHSTPLNSTAHHLTAQHTT